MTRTLLLLVGAYLLGSMSFSVIAVWAVQRVDLRTLGSGNAGATNVLRTTGRWPALVVLLLDIAKGYLPVRVARALDLPVEVAAGAALAVVLGHVYPVFFGFKGGRGVAPGFGAFLALFPLAAGASLLIFAGLVAASRYVSLGSVVSAAALPALAAAFARAGWTTQVPPVALALAGGCAALVILKHLPNLRRLAAGEERRLGERGRG